MNATLAGLMMLGGALFASKKSRTYTITVSELSPGGNWRASVVGQGTEYLNLDKRLTTARSGHEALKKLARGWNRAGFAE